MKNFLKFSLISSLLASSLFANSYSVDPSHSEIGFKIKHLMISNVKGSFSNFNGFFDYDDKSNSLISLSGNIHSNSISTSNSDRDTHLKGIDFFNSEAFDKISFVSTSVKDNVLTGNLTIKNVTKEIKLSVIPGGSITDLYGKHRAGFKLEGELKRSDFGLTYNKSLESGGVAIGDEVKLDIEIEGIQH